MRSSASFLLDHGLTLLTGAFAGAALTIGLSSFESMSYLVWSLLTFSILVIAFKKLAGLMTTKGKPVLRAEYLPACLFCFLIGAGLTGTFTWDFWGVTSSIGSLLAGTGTVGLLWFGWRKADEWIKQVQHSKLLDITSSLCIQLDELIYLFNQDFINEITKDFEEAGRKTDELIKSETSTQDYLLLKNLKKTKDRFLIKIDRSIVLIKQITTLLDLQEKIDIASFEELNKEIYDSSNNLINILTNELDNNEDSPSITGELISYHIHQAIYADLGTKINIFTNEISRSNNLAVGTLTKTQT